MEQNSTWIDLISKVIIPSTIPIVVGVITYVIAKKQITNTSITQFRQKWIDDLRNCISVYIAKAEMISMLELDDNENYREHFKELAQTQNKIVLMLNPNEEDHNKVIVFMDEIRELIHQENINDDELQEQLNQKIKELLEISKTVLKREWVVVKKGK